VGFFDAGLDLFEYVGRNHRTQGQTTFAKDLALAFDRATDFIVG
jgi:hypothetical protein